MRARELIEKLGYGSSLPLPADFEVKGISCNSKETSDNFIFVAVEGERADGHRFIGEAIDRGAKVIVVNELRARDFIGLPGADLIAVKDTRNTLARLAAGFYGNPSSRINVVGVTGTNGKTTITYLLEALLKEAGLSSAVIGTVNYRFKNRIIPALNTTPGPLQLQSILADMAGEGIKYAVMEVSSHALSQDRTEGIIFHSAIFSNLSQDHLDYHKTLEDYFQAKAKLFKNLQERSFAVINNDDERVRTITGFLRAQAITYAIDGAADITARDIKLDIDGTSLLLKAYGKEIKFKTRLIGRHNIYNLLAAFAWAFKAGLDEAVTMSALSEFSFIPGRLERVGSSRGFQVFVDYAHTEDALDNVLKSLRQLCAGKIIALFGCGGERDKDKRPKMGRVASELSDHVIITSDNPRSEDPAGIIEDILKGIKKDNCSVIPDRKEAIQKALSIAGDGDIVLIAGKGHENYQVLKDGAIHFDDREVVRECLKSAN